MEGSLPSKNTSQPSVRCISCQLPVCLMRFQANLAFLLSQTEKHQCSCLGPASFSLAKGTCLCAAGQPRTTHLCDAGASVSSSEVAQQPKFHRAAASRRHAVAGLGEVVLSGGAARVQRGAGCRHRGARCRCLFQKQVAVVALGGTGFMLCEGDVDSSFLSRC